MNDLYYNGGAWLYRELMLVADALRLGGAILTQYPDLVNLQIIANNNIALC